MSISVRESSKQKPSYWHSVGTEPLSTLTLGQLVDMAAERWADKEAVKSLYEGRSFTFRELRDKADRLAAGLLQLGLSPGDRLGIWGPNSSDWFISRIAAARAGLIAVLMDPAYQGPQLLHSFNKVDIKALICSEFYKTNSCYQIVRTVIPELDNCPESGIELRCSKAPSLKALILMSEKKYRGAYRLSDIMASARPETIRIIQELQTKIQPDEGCAIQFSSGTTGSPKGALLSNHNIVNNSMMLGRRIGLDAKGAKTIAGTPYYHTSGTILNIFCTLSFGVTTVIAAPVLDARRILEGIIQERCTHIFTTPSLYLDLISTSQDLGLKVTTLEVASYGAAPCSQELALQIKEVLNARTLIPIFGMTEVAAVFCSRRGDTLQQTTATVGYVIDHCEAKVVDKEGRMVPMGTPGELWVRGYSVMLGYWNEEEKTRQFIGPDGWAKTGDQFVLQEDGYGRIVGRLKDMIIRISDNTFPVEIEEFFAGHPDILEAQAFGVPDTKVGEEICVFLRLRDGATLTEQDVRNYCKDKGM
ncbi:medium-chain acyl-CoA ligase ACSF2, mitochondrial isoform X2 [Cryptotermes secundus]|uniref:medium-chain acyl-CoA ligase ACSF2, mitochondrial isoform X2 n=1 Tax=Cryptotermes secundus TaxID=105785 RepID=UPI000CD7C89A|nr:medium-chain acyl-CoA ligase ACSF2, mitochondrial isoform X2 [Cryptotermes secundus]